MKDLPQDIKKIYSEERLMFILMLLNIALSLALLVFSIIKLNPGAAVVKIGYGDIGGYRDGTWSEMLAFPLLALIFGFLHNIIAVRIFKKRGAGMTKFFLITTTALIIGAFIVLIRLLKEG
ncbi:hypothetical protein IKF57_00370 [Candidatus Saccharibacteria bacterium]|nr:hypothetical protein [Candidatus Saccharibacteria bacterium]